MDPNAPSYVALARRVAAAEPEAVFFGGLLNTNAAGVVRAVRAAAPNVDVLAPDGVTPLPLSPATPGSRRAGHS